MPPPRYVSISQASRLTGVSRPTIIRWIAAKKLKATEKKLGYTWAKLVDIEKVRRLGDAIRKGRPRR